MPEFYLGRQPIFDRKLEVMGYELLFRAQQGSASNVVDGDSATSQVILNTLLELGLDRVVGERQAFINMTRSFILNTDLLPEVGPRLVVVGRGQDQIVPFAR